MVYKLQQLISDLAAGRAGKTLLALACVLFLSAQTVELSHSHGNDANQQADCEICLKLGTDDDEIIDSTAAQVSKAHSVQSAVVQSTWLAQVSLTAHARAPPHA